MTEPDATAADQRDGRLGGDVQTFEDAFSDALLAARQARGMSQRELAAALAARGLHLDTTTITRIEKKDSRKRRLIRLGEALVIANVLNIDLDAVLFKLYPPTHHLQQRKRDADVAFEAFMEYLNNWLVSVREVQTLLIEFPELLDQLGSSDGKQPAPSSAAAFFTWEAKRKQREMVEGEWLLVRPDDELTTDGYRALLAAVASEAVEDPLPEPERPPAIFPTSVTDLRFVRDRIDAGHVAEVNLSETPANEVKAILAHLRDTAIREQWHLDQRAEGVYLVFPSSAEDPL